MAKTPEDSKFDYAVSANFNVELPCKNQRNINISYSEDNPEFIEVALYKLKQLVEESIESNKKGEDIPLVLEIYDAEVYSTVSSTEHD